MHSWDMGNRKFIHQSYKTEKRVLEDTPSLDLHSTNVKRESEKSEKRENVRQIESGEKSFHLIREEFGENDDDEEEEEKEKQIPKNMWEEPKKIPPRQHIQDNDSNIKQYLLYLLYFVIAYVILKILYRVIMYYWVGKNVAEYSEDFYLDDNLDIEMDY